MSTISSTMSTARTGIEASSRAMTVIGNNIANSNTVGYKAGTISFSDVVGESAGLTTGGSKTQGVRVQRLGNEFSQGALNQTGIATNLAIDGKGFFVVRSAAGQTYSRVGEFDFDKDGVLRTVDGAALQGFVANSDGTVGASIGDIALDSQSVPPQQTSRIDLELQLNADAPLAGPFDPANPGATSSFATSTAVLDSLGSSHITSVYVVKTAPNTWEWHAMVNGEEVVGGTPGVPEEMASGVLTFTSAGELDTESIVNNPIDFIGATPGMAPTFDFGQSLTTDGAPNASGSTQFASDSIVHEIKSDGFQAGELAAVRFENDGTIVGTFSNYEEKVIGKIALANFANPGGLVYAGDGRYTETRISGSAIIGNPGDGRHGNVLSEFLEGSNVDMTNEFVNLINYQRAFQANSRVISVSDEMLLELVNLRR